MEHRDIPAGEQHPIANWSVASTAARDALTPTLSDVGKVCYVEDVGYFTLRAVTPVTWEAFVTSSTTEIVADAAAFVAWATANAGNEGVLYKTVYIEDAELAYVITAVTPAVVGVPLRASSIHHTYTDGAEFAAATPTIDYQNRLVRVASTDAIYLCKVYGGTPQWVHVGQSAVAAHEAALDPHPQYATAAEAAAAAPVQSVNSSTGAVTVNAVTSGSYNANTNTLTLSRNNGQADVTLALAGGVSRTTLGSKSFWYEDFIGHYNRHHMQVLDTINVATLNGDDVTNAGMAGATGVWGFVPNANTWYGNLTTGQTSGSGVTKKTKLANRTISQLFSFSLDVLPAANQDYELCGGFFMYAAGSVSPSATEAFYWKITQAGITLNTYTGASGTSSVAVSLATAGITADTRLNIRLDYTSADVKLYVNNVLQATVSTNVPQSTAGPLSLAYKSAVGTQSGYANCNVWVDYADISEELTTTRTLA